jgi:hypothetical protein
MRAVRSKYFRRRTDALRPRAFEVRRRGVRRNAQGLAGNRDDQQPDTGELRIGSSIVTDAGLLPADMYPDQQMTDF